MKFQPRMLMVSGAASILGAVGVGVFAYLCVTRFAAGNSAPRPIDLAAAISDAQLLAYVCIIAGVLGLAMLVGGFVFWVHEK